MTRTQVDDDGITYSGTLVRTTRAALCEANDTPDGPKPCLGAIDGGGRFLVTITVPPRAPDNAPDNRRDNENASVVMKPLSGVRADVSGVCRSLDNAAVKADYEDGDTLYFETSDGEAGRVIPTGGLVLGTWSQSRENPNTGYKLVVTAAR